MKNNLNLSHSFVTALTYSNTEISQLNSSNSHSYIFMCTKKKNTANNLFEKSQILEDNKSRILSKHFSPSVKEWYNSLYAYNPKSTISLLIIDKMVVKIIKSYFNSLNLENKKNQFNLKKYLAFIPIVSHKVFVAKPEIKHTNSKVIITLYIYCDMYKNLGLLYKYINNEKKYSLAGFLAQIYTKKVTLIIIQLRYLQLNPGIIAERLANELTLWKRSPLSSLNRILNKVRIPEQKIHNLDKNSLENLTLLNSISSIKVKDTKVLRELNKEFIRNGIIASINSKITTGVKIQIAGRLTKRATAARAMFKVGHIGVLKNIDSSVIGRSVGLLRGAVRPNLDQTSFVSKSKNGAFSVRVWTSSYYSTLVNPKIIPEKKDPKIKKNQILEKKNKGKFGIYWCIIFYCQIL